MVERVAGVAFSFESQANQFPRMGPPGVVYERHSVGSYPDHGIVECLLFYRKTNLRNGILTGILYFYPEDIPPHEKAGAVNLYVDPQWRMRGVGRTLFEEAQKRWKIDWEKQRYTDDGLAFRLALEGRSEWQ